MTRLLRHAWAAPVACGPTPLCWDGASAPSSKPSKEPGFSRRGKLHRTTLTLLLFTLSTPAQTLAHRNWVGNGLTTTSWWQNAIIYNINTPLFQDSDGDGKGDLPGITQRLDYIQSLGIDAIGLTLSTADEHFDDLIRAANAHHLRVIVAVGFDHKDPIAEARQWLTHGAAGIIVSSSLSQPPAPLKELRRLVGSFPGDRVLIVGVEPKAVPQDDAAQLVFQGITFPLSLIPRGSFHYSPAPAFPLPHGSLPCFFSPSSTELPMPSGAAQEIAIRKLDAALLLLRPGAASLDFGQELGITASTSSRNLPIMAWTPTNTTHAPKPEEPTTLASNAPDLATYNSGSYTGYKPYVAPKPKPKPRDPSAPPDPTTLPGFSTALPSTVQDRDFSTANVATEDADPLSLLNFYRHLSQLHHDHPALRGGELTDIDLSAQKAFAWVIKAPAATRTAHNILVIANFSDKPQTLNLDTELTDVRLHPGGLRGLLATWTTTPPFEYTRSLTLPPFSLYAGEL